MRTTESNALGPRIIEIDRRHETVPPAQAEPVDYAEVDAIVERYRALKPSEALVLILQDVQRRHRYIPEPVMRLIGERMGLPMVQIYGVASFYQDFSMQPRAEWSINVCEGTSCYIRGSDGLRRAIRQRLGIDFGQRTADGRFGVERADYCYGCCQLGPVIEINHRFYPHMTPEQVVVLIDELAATTDHGPRTTDHGPSGDPPAPPPALPEAPAAAPVAGPLEPAGTGPASAKVTPDTNADAVVSETADQVVARKPVHGDRVGEDAASEETQVPPPPPVPTSPESKRIE